MRFPIVLLMCLMPLACGKTGALYLPEEPVDQATPAQEQKQEQSPASEENSN
jgi:predicted small lipoprotein YifL